MSINSVAYNAANYKHLYYLGAVAAGAALPASEGNELGQQLLFGAGVIGGGSIVLQGGGWLWQNRGNYINAFKAVKENARLARATRSAIKSGSWLNPITFIRDMRNYNKLQTIGNQIYRMPNQWDEYTKLLQQGKTKAAEKLRLESFSNARKASLYNAADKEFNIIKKLAEEGKLSGRALEARLSKVGNMIDKAHLKVLNGIKSGEIVTKGFWAKLAQKSGWNKINRGVLKLATKEGTGTGAKAVRALGKGGKAFIKGGGPLTFAIELGLETPEIVQTYKQLGSGAGTKQLAKSAVVAGASAIGWVAGAKAGAAIGTCIGGPIGTVVGGVLGAGLGILGSWLFGKGAKAVVGPSELEKARRAAAAKYGQAALTSDKGKVELGTAIQDKAAQEGGIRDKQLIAAYEKMLKDRKDLLEQCTIASQQHQAEWLAEQENAQGAITQPEGNIFAP